MISKDSTLPAPLLGDRDVIVAITLKAENQELSEGSDLATQLSSTVSFTATQSAEISHISGHSPDRLSGARPSRLQSHALGDSTRVYLKQRSAWIQAELSKARESIVPVPQEERTDQTEELCHVCISRGAFKVCPQMLSRRTNPRIYIEDAVNAALFASEVAKSEWRPSDQRIVLYTDAAAINGTRNDPDVAGAAVSYRSILGGQVSPWTDASYSILGTNDSTKAELYAIGSALDLALGELQAMCGGQGASLPTVTVLSDSKSSLYYVHDFVWQNSTPRIFRPADFDRSVRRPLSQLRDFGVQVEFHWVPGHAMVEGNCRADAAAGRASEYTVSQYPEASYRNSSISQVIRIQDDFLVLMQEHDDDEETATGERWKHVNLRSRSSPPSAYEIQASRIRGLQSGLGSIEQETSWTNPSGPPP